jgi:hypothetical protein
MGIQDDPISIGSDVHSVCKRCAWRSCRVGSASSIFPQNKTKKQRVKTMNEGGKKKTKTDSNKSTVFGKRLRFVVNVNSI